MVRSRGREAQQEERGPSKGEETHVDVWAGTGRYRQERTGIPSSVREGQGKRNEKQNKCRLNNFKMPSATT